MVAGVSVSFRRGLLILTLAGLAARLLWVKLEPSTYPVADETMWLTAGTQLLPSPEVAFYYAECLWQTATLTGANASLWRETAEQYTRVVHLDPKGPYVKEAAYAAVLA